MIIVFQLFFLSSFRISVTSFLPSNFLPNIKGQRSFNTKALYFKANFVMGIDCLIGLLS